MGFASELAVASGPIHRLLARLMGSDICSGLMAKKLAVRRIPGWSPTPVLTTLTAAYLPNPEWDRVLSAGYDRKMLIVCRLT